MLIITGRAFDTDLDQSQACLIRLRPKLIAGRSRRAAARTRSTVASQTHLAKVGQHLVGTAFEERRRLHVTPDPDDKAEPSGASRGDAGTRILEYNGAYWRTAETSRSFQKHVRSRLAAQPETVKIDTVDAYI